MNYSGNMPDWHQYNSTQTIGSEVPSVGQNVNHSPIFGPTISPRRLNGPTYSPEGLNRPQNEVSYNPRNFQQSPNTLNGPNVPPENPPMGSSAQMPGSHAQYGTPSPRNTMIEGNNPSSDSRILPGGSLSEAINQQNHQISMIRPAGQLNCPTINGSMGPMAQKNTPTNLQGSIATSSRQGPGTYVTCKGPCCNPDSNISYPGWEKFGPYSPNVPYRDTGYPVDNRRFGNEYENREQLGTTGVYNIHTDPRRNFPDYKYRKDPIIPTPYAPPPGVIQNYPVQNYSFPADYQKYPAYPVKEYPRENSIASAQNPAILKYQEQSVIVQQKYFTKQVQYQNGVIPKNIVPTSMGGNVISRTQNPYFNPQLARDFPRAYSESTPLPNRGIRSANPIHASYPKYQMYQQKIAMQRFSMENHLRELTQIPGYQSHPKYQECVLRYRELLRLQQTVDYQSTVQDTPKTLTSQGNEEIPPINLQFDQNGVLINTNFQPAGYSSNLQSPINVQNSKNVQSEFNPEVGPLNLQQPERFKVQAVFDDRRRVHSQNQVPSSLSQTEPSCETEQRYSMENHLPQVQKYESETLNLSNSDDSKAPCTDKRNSKDFADKPELDVRQFLANWDESEDEDGGNANLPDVVLSNSTSGAVPEYKDTTVVLDNTEEAKNGSENEDCRGRDDCGIFASTQNETKPYNSSDSQIYRCTDLPPSVESTNSGELDLSISNSRKQPVRTGTVIQSISTEFKNETPLHKLENFANGQAASLSCQVTKSVNNNESQEPPATVEADVIVKKESPVEVETIPLTKDHVEAYEHEAETEICSSVEDIIENVDDSRSCCEKESSEDTKHRFDSDDDLSESSDSDSMSSDSMSSFINSPKTIHGTEILVDAQELSVNPGSPKSNPEMVESPNLQKQSSFASEESHNPDDISLPDLPTSECTPISTTLNTPIHSDSEESSEPVVDLTTPANPIEIIQNSPMLSFTHSPIKMEPYEHLDENDSIGRASHFDFQASSSCDNDYGRLTDVSSHTPEQFNITQNDENTFDSDCVEVLSEKAEEQRNEREIETKNDVVNVMTDAFNNGNVMATDLTNNATVDTHRKLWPSVIVREHKLALCNNTEHEGVKISTEISEMDNKLSVTSEATEGRSNDDMGYVSRGKNHHSTSRWLAKCESMENLTALNLVKDENKIIDKPESLQVQSNSSNGEECNSTMKNQAGFPATVKYASSSEEEEIYPETAEDQSNFPGSSNIPLIPGEDFEEPKMPVLPMEGNCLTKILKNTSPITDLDVLGSDDEKLDKMDEIWMEVGGVDTVGKVTGANTEHTDCGEGFNREKGSKNKLRTVLKNQWKRVKNLAEAKDASESFGQGWNEGKEKSFRSGNNWQQYKSSVLEAARREAEAVNEDFQSAIISGTDNVAAVSQEKNNFSKATIFSKVTSNSFCHEDGNQNHDICSNNTVTEVIKCKEKINNINDIATKLLENARLCGPESKRMDVKNKESSPGKKNRDSSEKRIQLLKGFRIVKNKVSIDKPEGESEKSKGSIERDAVASVKITDQCKKMNVEITEEKEIDNIPQVPDTSTNSRSPLDSQVLQEIHVNTEEYASDLVSTDTMLPEEKLRHTLNDGEAPTRSKDTVRENCNNVNKKGSITVENNSCVNSHQSLNTKAVIPIEREDINERAINLSKSSNDFVLLNTLGRKGCVINDSHDSYVSEDDESKEPTETESEINEETTRVETKDQSPSSPRFSGTEDNTSGNEAEEANHKSLEMNYVGAQNITEGNRESNSCPTPTNLAKECILKGKDKQEIDEESSENAGHEKLEKHSSSPEKVDGSPETSENHKENVYSIYENCEKSPSISESNDGKINTCVLEQSDHPRSNNSADDNEDKTPDEKSVLIDAVDESKMDEEESMKLIDSFDDNEKETFLNPAPKEKISIESPQNSLQRESNVWEERVQSTDNSIKPASVPEIEKNNGSSLLVKAESKIVNDSSINIRKTSQDVDVTSNIHEEPITIHKDSESIEKSSILNDFSLETELGESTEMKFLHNITLEPVPAADESASTVDASLVAFGLEDSFNCDFNNFDVAPNISNITNTDESNSWKYSKAYARFEDCERYKNPDNFVNPILTSLDTLDNLNTVPVYTTKDGKITYSPNPKFTYRALIMEAREREGYPSMRESYYGNRTQQSSHYSKNQASFRKRKNTEGHSYSSRSYSKKTYTENYEPREHGESSMKKSPEPWNKSSFNHDKYSHQSKDQSLHHFTPYNGDAEKKYNAVQEKASGKYVQREGCAVFDEQSKRKNGTSDNFKCNDRKQLRQSTEQSASDSVWLRSKRELEGDLNNLPIALPRSETSKTNDNKKIKNSKSSTSTEKHLNNCNQAEDFNQAEKLTPSSDENKQTNQFATDNLPARAELSLSNDKQFVGRKFADLEVEEIESTSPKTEQQLPDDQNLSVISNNESNNVSSVVKSGLFSSEWEDSCENLIVHQEKPLELKKSAEPLLDEFKEVCDRKIKENKLCDELDEIHENKMEMDVTGPSKIKCISPSNSVEATIRNKRLEDTDCNQEKFNIQNGKSILNNTVNDTPSIPLERIQRDEWINEQNIPEILKTLNKDEQAASSTEEMEITREEENPQKPLPCTDNKITENCTSNVENVDHDDLVKENIQNEFESSNQSCNEVEADTIARKRNEELPRSSEESCSLEESAKIERREAKIKFQKIKSESKTVMSVKNVQLLSNESQSLKSTSEYENTSKPQCQYENYITYSPSNESAEDTRAIPKLVIKKTDSSNCRNACLGPPTTTSHDLVAERVLDKDEQGSKATAHPKIPKILIRNAKSRPTTPSIEEITDDNTFSITTKEESKVPKVKIRFDEKRSRSPSVTSSENNGKTDTVESKIPKMKIKLEDRLPKVFIENVNKESSGSSDTVQKTIPKMKIKKFKGALRHIADTQILPVSIPRMFIYTELESKKETSLQTLTKKGINTLDKNLQTVASTSSQDEEETVKDADVKKIPKLKIKRHSSGCSIESNRKRHSMSPIQSELKKVKKSMKVSESNDKKQYNRSSLGSEHQESIRKVDTFSIEQSYELASFENVEYAAADQQQASDSVKGEETTSKRESISGTPEEIPKVIIKRASPSAEFKCELSKGRDAIIENKRWQPEVKLQRSWVLDCMAKDLNLDKLTLKLATPGSILKKCLTQKKPEFGRSHVENGDINTDRKEKKLLRSKSASDLIPVQGSAEILATKDIGKRDGRNASDVTRGLITRERCKSDLGSTFPTYSENSERNKKLRSDNHCRLDCKNVLQNCPNKQPMEDGDTVVENTNSKELNASESYDGAKFMETSERSPDKTLDENMNSKKDISTPKINLEASDRPLLDSDLNKRTSSSSSSKKNSSKSAGECFENSEEFTDTFMNDLEHSIDSVVAKSVNVETVKEDVKSGLKCTKEIRRSQHIEIDGRTICTSDKTAESNRLEAEETAELAAILMGSHDEAESIIDNTGVPGESVILQTAISVEPDILINKLEIRCPDASNAVDNLETNNWKNNTHKLDINDNSDADGREPEINNAAREHKVPQNDAAEQENTPTLNENVLITPVIDNGKSEDSKAKEIQKPNIGITSDNSVNCLRTIEYSKESQSIIEMLSDLPSREVEVQSGPTLMGENGICLYHEDAIPTQFELELEVMDNTESDPLEVLIPQDGYPTEECLCYSGDERNEVGESSGLLNSSGNSVILSDSKSETTVPEEDETDPSQVRESTYRRKALPDLGKEGTISSKGTDKRKTTGNSRVKTAGRYNTHVKIPFNCSDLLVKEVLAAKETLRKCLARSKTESRFKPKARPKTAAEKKQGSSFDLSRLAAASENSFTKLENYLSNNLIAGTNSLKEIDEGSGGAASSNEKFCQNQTETECKVNKIKFDRKHSKGGKSNVIEKKYSSLPKNIHKLTNLTQIEGCLIPKNSSIDIKDIGECIKGRETSVSLKNPKFSFKDNSYSDTRKKIPELINSKDSKCRSNNKSSRHDVNSKYGKSTSGVPNNASRESSLDLCLSQEKSVSDATKHKYKSLKTLSDQNVNLTTDKTEFKFYKIPKIAKPTHPEVERLTEELKESQMKEAKMPILEPQVDFNGGIEGSELSSDRETSRSPPLITNQSLKHQISFNEVKEDLAKRRTMLLDQDVPEATPSKETTVADIVNNMAYHEKATIRHRRYCTLCERWFPTVARHRRHLSGYQHRHTELTQRRTIHALFTLFTGRLCPRLQPPGVVRIDCEPGELTPLQIAVQGVTKESTNVDNGNITKPSIEDK